MNCSDTRDLLSAFYDNELSVERRADVSAHLATCADCARTIASFNGLSAMAAALSHPDPPSDMWASLQQQLDREPETRPIPAEHWTRRSVLQLAAIAALLLVAISLGTSAYHAWFGHGHHDDLAANFSRYLDLFQTDPAAAQHALFDQYGGARVDLDQAERELRYRPVVANGLPDDYTMKTVYVLDMPCCKCVQCVCQRSDGTTITIFEHDDEQPVWFGNRPTSKTRCGGRDCSVVQVNGQIAVSWKLGKRSLTIVGAEDIEEATRFVEHLSLQQG